MKMFRRICTPLIILSAFFNSPAHSQEVRDLDDAYLCVSYGTQAGQIQNTIDFLISRMDEELDSANYWASQGDAQLANAFYDKVQDYGERASYEISEYESVMDRMNAFCANVPFQQGVIAAACAGAVGNPWCDHANR